MVLNKLSHSACKVYSLIWSECSSSLRATALNLRNVEDLTDVTISAGGKIFPAHKLVLSSASPLLMELLKNTKCQHPILMLAGISATDFEKILDFIYQGEINVDSEKLPSLLQAAQFLDIRALSPFALVANSFPTPLPVPSVIANKDVTKNDSLSLPSLAIGTAAETSVLRRNPDFAVTTKRKAPAKMLETSKPKTTKSSFPSAVTEATFDATNVDADAPVPKPNLKLPPTFVKLNKTDSQEAGALDEKKIISDLPVNCKLCGVTIRQSRNLRRHIDQKHSEPKSKLKDKKNKSKLQPSVATESTEERNDLNLALLDFSEDSFPQFAEEILDYSANSESTSSERTFVNLLSIDTASEDTCLPEDVIIIPHESPSSSSSSASSSSVVNSLSKLLEDNSCFQLATKDSVTSSTETRGQDESLSSESSSSVENFECSNLGDSCNMNDTALKELEHQLFSVCFCTVENDA